MSDIAIITGIMLVQGAAVCGLIEGRRAKEGPAYTALMTVSYGAGAVLGLLLATLVGEVLGLV